MARFTMFSFALACVLICAGCKNPPRLETDNPPRDPAPATEWGPKRTPVEGSYRGFSDNDPTVVEPDIGDAVPPGKHLWHEGYYETTEEIPWEDAWRATRMAYEDEEWPVVEERRMSYQGWLIARLPTTQLVRTDFYYRGKELTGIRIRYGLYGGIAESRDFNALIRENYDELLAQGATMEAERAAAEAAAETELEQLDPSIHEPKPEEQPDTPPDYGDE